MTGTLTDFLRERGATHRADAARRGESVREWVAALDRLYARVRDWLAAADPDGVLACQPHDWELNEEGLGEYTAPGLEIRGLGRRVRLVPRARQTIAPMTLPDGASGRSAGLVHLTDDTRRHYLYRLAAPDGDVWVIDDQRTGPRVFDRAAFEAVLVSYLR